MSLGDQVSTVEKRGCRIVTCDPSTQTIEALTQNGEVVLVNAYTQTPFWRWPAVGENWMIRMENGSWFLEALWQTPEEAVENMSLDEGDALIITKTGKVALSSGGQLVTAEGGFETGDLKATMRVTAPTGWLMLHGQEEEIATYPDLYKAMGSVESSAGKFKLPNGENRSLIGASGTHALGTTGGEETVKLTYQQSGVPAHTHTASGKFEPPQAKAGELPGTGYDESNGVPIEPRVMGVSVTVENNTPANAAEAHTNMPPFLAVNWMIKT